MSAKCFRVSEKRREKIASEVKNLTIDDGDHGDWDEGHCVMEVVAHFNPSDNKKVIQKVAKTLNLDAEEEHTDNPWHADALLTHVMISLNDNVSGDVRQLLKPLVPWLVGSVCGEEKSKRRMLKLLEAIFRRQSKNLCKEKGRSDKSAHYCRLAKFAKLGKIRSIQMAEMRFSELSVPGSSDFIEYGSKSAAWDAAIESSDNNIVEIAQDILSGDTDDGSKVWDLLRETMRGGRWPQPASKRIKNETELIKWFVDTVIKVIRDTK